MNESLSPVAPTEPVAPYLGGKRHLAARIVARLAMIPHDTYVEPFVGMGGVFLRRPFRARGEVINDISGDVATLFRVLQRHYVALMDLLRWQVTSRAEFERLLAANPATLTDLERAARFLYVQRLAYGGKVTGRNFGVVVGGPARFDVTRLAQQLAEVHERLAGVVIEQLPFLDVLTRYDSPGTLFYLDPPYFGGEMTMAKASSAAPTSCASRGRWQRSRGASCCRSTTTRRSATPSAPSTWRKSPPPTTSPARQRRPPSC